MPTPRHGQGNGRHRHALTMRTYRHHTMTFHFEKVNTMDAITIRHQIALAESEGGKARKAIQDGNFDLALYHANQAARQWDTVEKYACQMLKPTKIDD